MPKIFTSKTQKIGELGEEIACKFLMKHGFAILEQNYTKKWGEIDIVAEKDGCIRFIEVKSVSRDLGRVSGETDGYKPEDNIHPWKIKRLSRTMQTYLLEKNVPENKEWQFDICSVYLDMETRKARVEHHENIIF